MNLFSQYAQYTANPAQTLDILEGFPENLRNELQKWSPQHLQALLNVLGNSNFLARWAQRYPEKLITLHRQGFSDYLDSPEMKGRLENLQRLSKDDFTQGLIELKYECLFAISLEDLGAIKVFESIVARLSQLAAIILQQCLIKQESELAEKIGQAFCKHKASQKIPFSVIGMGKLGGGELNFSSDVDLIYFYGSDLGEIRKEGQASSMSIHEYFVKLSEALSLNLSKKTAEGFLYRVDVELRPEGKSGALANSIDAMVDYYESFGADWEKQAMIKANCIAGDKNLFEDFFAQIHPFVYPKSTDFSFLKNLRIMKEKIIDSVNKLSHRGYHVKLGDGGIREIEFFVQAFQFLLGGKIPELQTTSTLQALQRLAEAKIIEAKEYESLRKAYIFLRTMEHRLQLVEERQTHQLPTHHEELQHLARRMGYNMENIEEATLVMLADLEQHRHYVKNRFEALLARGS